MLQFIRRHKALSFAFSIAFVLTFVFLFRLTASAVYWSDPLHVDQPIAGWMTPRYVSKSWSVPPEIVANVLGLEKDGGARRITLDQIANKQKREFDSVVSDLDSAIAAFRKIQDE